MRRLIGIAKLAVRVGQAFSIAVSLYQTTIIVLGYRRSLQLRGVEPAPPDGLPRFGLIVCARNEAEVIGRIVVDLLAQDYPVELRDVVVIAHNCTDLTALRARNAGAGVVELTTGAVGKAYAVEAGIASLGSAYDYVGVFDADARISESLLREIARHSRGRDCMQAETVPIADAEWLAEGYGFGRKARNLFWWRPREALGISTTITGSGWFIRPELFHNYSTDSWTMTEDLELSARLVTDGHRIHYVSSAQIACGETRSLKTAVQQRSRWVRGHIGVVKGRWLPLVGAVARGNIQAADLAIYLIAPSRTLTQTGVSLMAGTGLLVRGCRLPTLLVGLVMAAEWGVPAWIAWRERLLRLSSGSLSLAGRHTFLGLLWFPIGIWAMGTARLRAWHAMPRTPTREANNVG